MTIPTITMSCNSLPLTAIETAANNCELDTTTKKFGSGSIKILQGGYIDVAVPSVFNMLTDSWTVEHWFNITDLETDNYHHLINADNNVNGHWSVYVDNTGKLALNRRGGAANTSTVAVADNEWHHLRVTHTGDKTLKAYLDGNLFATNTFSAAPDSMRIGKTLGESTRWYTGNIDEVALTILDSSNVAEYSGDTAPVPTEGYPDEVRSPGVVIDGLFLSTSKPKAGDKGLLVNNKFFIPFAESSGSGDTSAFESDAMAIIGTPTGGGSGGGMTSRNSLYYFPLDTDYKSYGRNSTFELSAKDDDGFVPAHFNFGAKATGNIDVSTIFKSDFTIDFWSKVISASGNGIVNFYYLWMTGAEQPLLYYQFDGNTQYHAINGHSITPDDNWHHFAIVRSGTNVKTYMDGIEILSANVTDDLSLGGVNLDAAQYLQVDGGTINNTSDGYRSTPLTLDELHITDSALWTADFTPPTLANSLT